MQVHEGKMPVNHEITFLMQDIFNLLPNLNVEELVRLPPTPDFCPRRADYEPSTWTPNPTLNPQSHTLNPKP